MRGRLRIVSDDNLKTTTWAEVPEEYWREVLEKDVEIPIIHVPPLAKGSEIPEYGEKKRQEEGVTAEAISKKVPKCTKCQKEGHNQRTCRSLVQKDEVQNKKQKVNATDANLKDNNERTKASAPTNSHSPKRTKQLARKTVRSSPLKHGVIVVPEVKNGGTVAVASHGGIVKPFKAPARVPFKTPLDVQPVRGQKYTSLKNLEAAKYEREKNKGKTKM
ncbi:hypothetical protein POM88_043673 [Heracleum sosnowskyi]|uniref:CCHC-type domain-containing protein n=1 Tax=Heracleum sosnowskyi TaxID=360622 RepID=A0AAD8H2I3_9APIA|nr:hypothetical protein POM88_043673 [Heracleum sosnowskyi]